MKRKSINNIQKKNTKRKKKRKYVKRVRKKGNTERLNEVPKVIQRNT